MFEMTRKSWSRAALGGSFLVLLASCKAPTVTVQAPPLDPSRGVVLPESLAIALLGQCSRPTPVATAAATAPTPAEVAEIERHLPLAIRLAFPEAPDSVPVDVFYRQYAAIQVGGRRVIYVNGFHQGVVRDEATHYWRTSPMIACDGGKSFFGTSFDPEYGTLEPLIFNGPG
jgi:hypothetical protein